MTRILLLIMCALVFSGCSIVHVRSECKPVNAPGYDDLWLCKNQWKVWN